MENKDNFFNKKNIAILALTLFALTSFFILGNVFSKPQIYIKLFQTLDIKRNNVMGLAIVASASSTAISALPNDLGTPIANELADLNTYLLMILTVVYLEKYLLTVIGYGVFKVIIPIGCIFLILYQLFPKNFSLKSVGIKIMAFGVALLLLVPTSVTISNFIDTTYQESITETLNNAGQQVEIEEGKEEENKKEDIPWYESLYNFVNDAIEDIKDTVETSTVGVVEKLKNVVSNMVEATAVMIVTSCAIPLLTVVVFVWLTNIILGVEIPKPDFVGMKNKIRHKGE